MNIADLPNDVFTYIASYCDDYGVFCKIPGFYRKIRNKLIIAIGTEDHKIMSDFSLSYWFAKGANLDFEVFNASEHLLKYFINCTPSFYHYRVGQLTTMPPENQDQIDGRCLVRNFESIVPSYTTALYSLMPEHVGNYILVILSGYAEEFDDGSDDFIRAAASIGSPVVEKYLRTYQWDAESLVGLALNPMYNDFLKDYYRDNFRGGFSCAFSAENIELLKHFSAGMTPLSPLDVIDSGSKKKIIGCLIDLKLLDATNTFIWCSHVGYSRIYKYIFRNYKLSYDGLFSRCFSLKTFQFLIKNMDQNLAYLYAIRYRKKNLIPIISNTRHI